MLAKINWEKIDWSKSNVVIAAELSLSRVIIKRMRTQYAPETRSMIPKETWQKVDWSKSDGVIAKALDSRKVIVGLLRKKYAPMTRRAMCALKIAARYRQVDFNRPSKVIAAELGCGQGYILVLRRKYAPETLEQYRGLGKSSPRYDWHKVDWRKYDTDLAKELGCSEERVRQKRLVLAPETHKSDRRKGLRVSKWVAVNFQRPNQVIAAEMQVGTGFVAVNRRKFAPETCQKFSARILYHWSKVDWTKPRRVIAAELGCSYAAVAAAWYRKYRVLAAAGQIPAKPA